MQEIMSLEQFHKQPNIAVAVWETTSKTWTIPKFVPGIERMCKMVPKIGKEGELVMFYPEQLSRHRVMVCGMGRLEANTTKLQKVASRAVRKAIQQEWGTLVFHLDSFISAGRDRGNTIQQFVVAAFLANYQFVKYKTKSENVKPLKIGFAMAEQKKYQQDVQEACVIAKAMNESRELANQPGNLMFPEALASAAVALGKAAGVKVKVLHHAELKRLGFGALLAVGGGSVHSPVLIEMQYFGAGKNHPPIVLVGKGITFDSGGICLKPAIKMDAMKFDMSGAVAVIGILRVVAALKMRVNLIGLIPAAENMPSGSACRPGDIVKSFSGQTIEVLNTDAEGRLILADAIGYATRKKPSCIIDLATLTGAVVVALGKVAIGMLSNHQPLANEIQASARDTGEKIWQLPLWDEYRELVKSEIADVANIGKKEGAGTIVGAAFLEKFVQNIPWVHLDIAGTAYGEVEPIFNQGATGAGIRLLVDWLKKKCINSSKK